jgi:hypothetical protein
MYGMNVHRTIVKIKKKKITIHYVNEHYFEEISCLNGLEHLRLRLKYVKQILVIDKLLNE